MTDEIEMDIRCNLDENDDRFSIAPHPSGVCVVLVCGTCIIINVQRHELFPPLKTMRREEK